jgi:hypothetical protein
MSKILYGADPETAAVYDKDGILSVLPPWYFRNVLGVESTETDTEHPIFLKSSRWKVHEDGAAFEFSVQPSHDPYELFQTIQEAASETNKKILNHFPADCLPGLQFLPAIQWEIERWKDMGDEFKWATRFGCNPDRDIYDTRVESREEDASEHPWRYLGGHLHISGSPRIVEDPDMAVRCMMITAGLAATAFSTEPERERQRVYRYGKPGRMRVQNYGINNPYGEDYAVGIEYRTMSALWAGNWTIAERVLSWAKIGIENLLEGGLGMEIHNKIVEPAKEAILTCNQNLANELLTFVESRL